MRIPLRCYFRRAQRRLSASNLSTLVSLRSCHQNAGFISIAHSLAPRRHLVYQQPWLRRCMHTDNARSSATVSAAEDATTHSSYTKNPGWVQLLNKYLPSELRVPEFDAEAQLVRKPAIPLQATRLAKILARARKSSDEDVLLWLVDNGFRKTAVWLMETVLNFSVSTRKTPQTPSLSNIDWPSDLFTTIDSSAVVLPTVNHPTSGSIDYESQFTADLYESRDVQAESRLLQWMWETIGLLIIRSTVRSTNDVIDDNMLTALLVLGHVHRSGMMPDDVYAHNTLRQPCFVQRPPILNLVSSRILTALSDVAWRQQQDDAINQAASTGMSLREISENVPGGRFRLKVRPLGPEVWLELVLWCCMEAHHTSAAVAIIKALTAQEENPWFAIRWTTPQSDETLSTFIDWDRVKLRHGGPAGLIEGYSRERPFVDVPKHTISVEVVLALVERLITSISPSSIFNASKPSAFIKHKNHRPLRRLMADIEDAMTFLEPHDLPTGYFDYLETRLLQVGAFDATQNPAELHAWSARMGSIRSMEKVHDKGTPVRSLELEGIYAYSQLHIGVQHQAMDVLVRFGDLHNALIVFNEIQETVDKTKVGSIADFLRQQHSVATIPDSLDPASNHELEFTNSHGQLPNYKLASLLNLISETKLIGLGRWLLYADDVDGSIIPEELWGLPCMTAALYRFAAASQDRALLASATLKRQKIRPSIKMVRALINANMDFMDLENARVGLSALRDQPAGGLGLSNLVHLAATILRLETMPLTPELTRDRGRTISTARTMMEDMLCDSYSSTRSDFTIAQQLLFKQQIRHILRIFPYFRRSCLQNVARKHSDKLPGSNLALLPAGHFNVLLAAAIDAYGVEFGKQMWERFCQSPSPGHAAGAIEMDSLGYDAEPDTPASLANNASPQSFNEISPADEILHFDDPFFPPARTGESFSQTTLEADWQNVEDKSAAEGFEQQPVTIPNLQTLRLIVRAAADEHRSSFEQGINVPRRESHLEWAIKMFTAFGITDKDLIEQEMQIPLHDLDAKVTNETRSLLEAAQKRDVYEQASTQDFTAGDPVSEMWVPQHRRRPDVTTFTSP